MRSEKEQNLVPRAGLPGTYFPGALAAFVAGDATQTFSALAAPRMVILG